MKKVVLAALVALLVAMLAGCTAPSGTEPIPGILVATLAGTQDLELTYEVAPAAAQVEPSSEEVRALVLRRLGAVSIGADVDVTPDPKRRVAIVVDETLASRVDELVTWTGTLLLLEPDPAVVLAPRDLPAGLVAASHPDSGERWFEGARADVLRAVETLAIDREHRIVAEPISDRGTERERATRWRTRVVKAIALGELGDGALVGSAEGARIRIHGVGGSASAAAIEGARSKHPVVARGRISLGLPAFEDDALLVSFGSGAEAYARAQHERHLLTTPRLPSLRRVGAVGLPPNRGLALACVVVPAVLSVAWLLFVRRFDRAHPEPIWLVATTFALGAVATLPAGLVEVLCASVSPWLDPNLITFGGQKAALPLAFVVDTLVVGLSEEGAKRLAAHFAIRRPEFDEPVDGIVYAIAASLGFAAAENVRYFALGRMSAPLVVARCFMSVPAHMFFGALWGYALGAKLVDPRRRTWTWLLGAAAAHGLFDALLSTEDAGLLAVLLNVGLASAFVMLVRRALRHGVVTKEMVGIRPEDRVLFRVGRPTLFWASAVMLHVLAFGIFLLGAYHQLAHHRPTATFVIGSSAMLALLAVAALGVAETLPLDAAIDGHGVTFAGAARAWKHIRAFAITKDHVAIDSDPSPIEVGPAPRPVLDAIAAELQRRIGKQERVDTLESRAT